MGEDDKFAPVAQFQFVIDIAVVVFEGAFTHAQLLDYFLYGFVADEQVVHLLERNRR